MLDGGGVEIFPVEVPPGEAQVGVGGQVQVVEFGQRQAHRPLQALAQQQGTRHRGSGHGAAQADDRDTEGLLVGGGSGIDHGKV